MAANKSNGSGAEDQVRRYLTYLEEPSKLLDAKKIATAQAAVDKASDPIDKLKAVATLTLAKTVDEEAVIEGFTTHAKAWAAENGIPVSAFENMNVPKPILASAGFRVAQPGKQASTTPRKTGQRAKPVPTEEIQVWIRSRASGTTFHLTDIMSAMGIGTNSQATTRKAIQEEIAAGNVLSLGPDPMYSGRGRAPIKYERV